MKINRNYNLLIIDYLNGDLTGKEREEFEHELNTNPELNRMYRLHCKVDKALMQDDVNRLRDMLEEIHHEVVNKKHSVGWLKYAAAALILISVATAAMWIIMPGRHQDSDKLFARYYHVYETPGDVRSGINQTNTIFSTGLQLYDVQDYQGAYSNFIRVMQTDSSDMATPFYTAISLMELERYNEAIPYLQTVIDHQDILFSDQARWYLALTYLKTENIPGAEELLQELKRTSHHYQKMAGTLLSKMRHD